jgi:RES domain-containing protein
MTTMLSLILALMLSIGGSPAASVNPAACPGDTGIQAPIDNNPNINRFFEDYREKTASRPISKKILEIPLMKQPKKQIRLRFSLSLKEELRLVGYMDSMNLYQAFGMNPVNFVDPFGAQAIHPHDRDPEMQWMSNYKPLTLKDIDSCLTEISTNTQYMVQGGINLVFGGAQWVLHQANAFFSSLRGVDYYSYDLVTYQFDFDNPAGIYGTVDTRPSAEKALGMAGLDTVTGLYYWGKSGIMLLDPNLSAEESTAYKKSFFGGIPGVALLAYGGYRFGKSKMFKRVEYPSDSITFKGEVFRYETPKYMETSWSIHKGNIRSSHRYSGSGKGALYSSLDAWTAFKEVRSDLGRWLTVKRAKVKGILDLTDPKIRQNLGISLRDIAKKGKYDITQGLGDLIRNKGYKGILAPSAQNPGGVNLVLFDVKMLFNKIR